MTTDLLINLLPGLTAAFALSLLAGPIGCFVVWRRMAYFGDGLAHSALLGIALGMFVEIGSELGILLTAIVFALLLAWLQDQSLIAGDTLIGLLAHAALAFGLLALALAGLPEVELHDYFVGQLETLDWPEALGIMVASVLGVIAMAFAWPNLVRITANAELARSSGVAVRRYNMFLMVLLALFVALSVQMVGILLVTSLLIMPAATARLLTTSPEAMGVSAGTTAMLASGIGLLSAGAFSLPSGPAIVVALITLFGVSLTLRVLRGPR